MGIETNGATEVDFVERDAQLRLIDEALERAAEGRGGMVLITGEPGVGKTTLVQAFLEKHPVRVLRSACDDLATARALGPIRDLARQAGGSLKNALDGGDQTTILEALVDELAAKPGPNLLVIEDLQWIDEASADALKFVGRRIEQTSALLLATARESDLATDHPARLAFADVPPHLVTRVELEGLSVDGIARLGGVSRSEAERIHGLTGGNPFFVAEVLATGGDHVPASVVDAVLARSRQLDDDAVATLELVSCVPSRAERRLVYKAVPGSQAALGEIEDAGLFELDREFVWFRHELARQAVEETLTETRREELNAKLLIALEEMDADPARLVHHAEAAADQDAVARWAPVAARHAVAVGSHREALEHYTRAVELLDRYGPEEAADIVEGLAQEHQVGGDSEATVSTATRTVELRRKLGDPVGLGKALILASRAHWFVGERQEAEAASEEAIATLEPLGSSTELARAYSNRTQLAMLWGDVEATERWGDVAISMAREVGDPQVLGHALNNVGSQRAWKTLAREGLGLLHESRDIAAANGFDYELCRAYINIAWETYLARLIEPALDALETGLAAATSTQQTALELYLRGSKSAFLTVTGDLDEAARSGSFVLERPEPGGISLVPAAVGLGLVHARRGDFEAARPVLQRGWDLAMKSQEIQRTSMAAMAMAEFSWLEGRDDATTYMDHIDWSPYAAHDGHAYEEGAMVLWYRRVGSDRRPVRELPPPIELALRDEHGAGAKMLSDLGAQYSAAEMLMDSNDPSDVEEAVRRLEAMGATAVAARAQERLAGLRTVTRVLATVLFTDLIGSTAMATELGDAAWRQRLDEHDRVAQDAVHAHRGRFVKSTGDGILATFEVPSEALNAAIDLRARLERLELPMRAGVHTGEVEVRGDDIGGLAVHIASRLAGLTDAVVASSTTRELAAGASLAFDDLGEQQLRGIEGSWRAYRVVTD